MSALFLYTAEAQIEARTRRAKGSPRDQEMSDEPTPQQFENRRILIAALRDRSKWPKGFKWDFERCSTCAIGLSRRLGLASKVSWAPFAMTKAFAIPAAMFQSAFLWSGGPEVEVTPEMVADRLEKLFAEES